MSSAYPQTSQFITRFRVLILGGIFGLACIGLVIGRNLIPQIVKQFYFTLPEHPYFPIGDIGMAYLFVPLVVLCAIMVWIFPGLALILVLRQASRFSDLLIKGFGLSFILYAIQISILKFILPGTPTSEIYISLVIITGLFTWGILLLRVSLGQELIWPFLETEQRRRLVWTCLIPMLGVWLFFPVLFWQDMHGDGFEALEIGRSLTQYILPRFPTPTGVIGLGIGMLPMAFPVHWFITLFGAVEISARLPFLLYLPVVFCLLLELIEFRLSKRLGVIEESLLVFALVIYSVAMSFNASYYPYFSDIAAPTAFETLTILCILGSLYFLWKNNRTWFILFAITSYLCRPTGLMFLGLMAVGMFIFLPEYRRRWLPTILGTMAACFLIGIVYDRALLPWISGTTEFGYQSGGLVDRVRYIRLIEPYRVNFALFPTGILPFLSLFFLKIQDRYARMISVVVLIYFVMFFFFAYVAMHHFVPAMILPLVVFWRIYLSHPQWDRRIVLSTIALAAVISIGLSLPRNFEIFRSLRAVGVQTEIKLGDYNQSYLEIMQHESLLSEIIRPQYAVTDPSKELTASILSIIYYSNQQKISNTPSNIIVQSIESQTPLGYTQLSQDNSGVILVRDIEQLESERTRGWRTDFQSPLYKIPQSTLFYFMPAQDNTRVIDLMQVAGRIKRLLLGKDDQ